MSSYNLLKTLEFSPSLLKLPIVDGEAPIRSDFLPLGGFLCDSKYAWLAKGAVLQIISTTSHSKISEWIFGNILKDPTIQITSVAEIARKGGGMPLLAVGLQSNLIGGFICIFDVALSKVIRTIDVKNNVSSVIFVEVDSGSVPLPGPLRAFDGVLAVGLNRGDVLLIDLCWQILDEVLLGNADVKDELNPSEIVILLNKNIAKIEHYKEKSIRKGFHLAIHLNYVDKDPSEHFKLKAPTGETIVLVNSAEVTVSALHYCPQLGSLLVGYNFGALQLWDVINMKLMYTSPVYEKNMPVSHFAIQEPSDDPKAFCYIWAVYSSTEPFINDFPVAALYSFTYTTKEYHEGYGFLYEGFVSSRVRFQMDLMLPDDYVPLRKPKGAWCVRLEALNKNRNVALTELPDDNLVISCFMWTVWCSRTETYTYQAIFDLNQWYKEQMPGEPNWDECSSYLMYERITELYQKENKENAFILATTIKPSSISQFMGVQRLEEHYYPSSLSFEFSVLREKDYGLFAVKGVQKTFLQKLQSTGPVILIQPSKLYQEAIGLGLNPLFIDVPSDISVSENDQRKFLLNIALEHQMLTWLSSCAREWANGSFSSANCTLDLLLSWAWQRAAVLKNNADNLCISLFDYSGLKLDVNSQQIVNCCCRQLANLHGFYTFILNKLRAFVHDYDLLQLQCNKMYMVSTYFKVLQWLLNVKLLPEYVDNEEFDSNIDFVPYPVEVITNYYNTRRADLLHLCEKRFREKFNLLFIDNLIETYCGGDIIKTQWKEIEGSGSYPPPSLQALLRTYLIENVNMSHKHSLVMYLFLDLAMVLNQDRYTETITQLIKFPAVFKLSQSLIKITQAFWQLDHEDFSTAVEHLLDPLVMDSDLSLWHHRIVLKALLVQKQYSFGLLYLKTRNPPLVNDDDFKLAISFYVANSMVDNAFSLLRKNGNNKPNDKLLIYLFSECVRFEKIREVLNYPLTLEEETAFFTYLETINHRHAQDIHVFYNIIRSRFMDAYEINTRSHLKNLSTKSGANVTFRDSIIASYKKLMPAVSQKLLSACQEERMYGLWKEVSKPLPMSVFIHDTHEQVKYKSTIVNASLSKAIDTWSHPILRNSTDNLMKSEETPFLRTPKVDWKEKRKMTPAVIEPAIIPDDESPSPPKRARLGTISETFMKKFDTPIVKRKSRPSSRVSLNDKYACTPQSILKVGNLVRKLDEVARSRRESTTPEDLNDMSDIKTKVDDESIQNSASKKRFSFGLTPRRSLSRLDNHSVRFTGLTTPSTSTTSESKRDSNSLRAEIFKTTSTEESFHSIESTLKLDYCDPELDELEQQLREIDEYTDEEIESKNSKIEETNQIKRPETPKCRRSLRSTPVPLRQSQRLARRISSDGSSSSSSPLLNSSTPVSSPKRLLLTKRMSLQRKVVTYNALKTLTPKKQKTETLYSKTDIESTRTTAEESMKESLVTSAIEEVIVKDVETSSENSFLDYRENNTDSYKELTFSNSIFQSDVEESKSADEIEDENINLEISTEEQKEQSKEIESDAEKDPPFNIYESPQELTGGNSPEAQSVLTEMPIMSEEQYSAMEESTFDNLHEEYFNEDVIEQEYFTPSYKNDITCNDTERTEPMTSEVIEINSSDSSTSEKDDAIENEESASSCISLDRIAESESSLEISCDDTSSDEAVKETEMLAHHCLSNEEKESSSPLRSHYIEKSIFDEETQELPVRNPNRNNEVSEYIEKNVIKENTNKAIEMSEAKVESNDNELLVTVENEEQVEYISENMESKDNEEVLEVVQSSESEENQKHVKNNEQELLEVIKNTEDEKDNEFESQVLEDVESDKDQKLVDSQDVLKVTKDSTLIHRESQELVELIKNTKVIENVKQEPDVTKKQEISDEKLLIKEETEPIVPEIEQNSPVIDTKKENGNLTQKIEKSCKRSEEKEKNLEKQQTTTDVVDQQKSDLDFSVFSETGKSKNLETTSHQTDLSFSLKTSKSDLDFTLTSDDDASYAITTSTPQFDKKVLNKQSEPAFTPRNTRSKSVELSIISSEPVQGRVLRKRSASTESAEKRKVKKQSMAVQLPVILEEGKEIDVQKVKPKRQTKKAQSTTDISEQRRITRRQKSLLEKIVRDDSSSSEEERGPALDPIDPMQLLHKSSFKGKPDPDEVHMQERSPSSLSRTSDRSELHSVSQTDVSRKRTFTKAKTISPPRSTIKTRSSTKSINLSAEKETKRKTRSSSKKMEDDNESIISGTSTRSRTRAASVSSVKSDTAAIHKAKQNPPRKSQKNLAKIKEEATDEIKPTRRITRASSSKI